MLRFFHVSRQRSQCLEAQFTPDTLEDVLGRVGSLAQPMALPGRLAATAGPSRSRLARQPTQFRHPFQGFGCVRWADERVLGIRVLVMAVPGVVRSAGFPSSHGCR